MSMVKSKAAAKQEILLNKLRWQSRSLSPFLKFYLGLSSSWIQTLELRIISCLFNQQVLPQPRSHFQFCKRLWIFSKSRLAATNWLNLEQSHYFLLFRNFLQVWSAAGFKPLNLESSIACSTNKSYLCLAHISIFVNVCEYSQHLDLRQQTD